MQLEFGETTLTSSLAACTGKRVWRLMYLRQQITGVRQESNTADGSGSPHVALFRCSSGFSLIVISHRHRHLAQAGAPVHAGLALVPVRVIGAHIPRTKQLLEIGQAVVDDPELMHDLILVGLRPSPGLILAGTHAGDQIWVRCQICCRGHGGVLCAVGLAVVE